MIENFTNEDILELKSKKYDLIFGNPPWQNFVDLPETYKEEIKRYFFKFDLIGNSQKLLLGGSRIDISALVIQVSIKDFLNKNGEAIFFMPLSLLLNDGANKNFRTYSIGETKYSIETVYDFNSEDVFGGIATRYALSNFIRDKNQVFPIKYLRNEKSNWNEYMAKPLFHNTDPLSIISILNKDSSIKIQPVTIKRESSPRQGINTCGANDVFFFNTLIEMNSEMVIVSNKTMQNIILPRKFIYPLISSKNFKPNNKIATKWVLLPYNKNGKPLDWNQIELYSELKDYLLQNKDLLSKRKGVMLNAMLKRGHWWAMLGVGDYCFFEFKVVWEAYGKTNFNPTIFQGNWQANQSLQAFIPVKSMNEAERIQIGLSQKEIENYLLSLKMEGTMNWAQPGKIKKLLQFQEDALTLF